MPAASTAAAPGLLSIEEYLNTTYRPDVDYVDGSIEERNLGETDHSKLQNRILFLLTLRQEEWNVEILPEVRVQVSPTRFRIPDACVARDGDADEPIVTRPPLLCLEVMSPRDSVVGIRQRAQEYLDMGVPQVWVFDPSSRVAYVCLPDSITKVADGILRLPATQVELSIEEIFKPLTRVQSQRGA